MVEVAKTAFDFRSPVTLGAKLDEVELKGTAGLDHCFVLGADATAAAMLEVDDLGLDVFTSEPGMQVYTANDLSEPHTGIRRETQHFPDSPNQPGFPSPVLRAGDTFESVTRFRFRVPSSA
ncbi:MAG: hypothetical protein U5O39_17355 [Gammaproteobacteria bacterium]|nr:hypothetical protein [Gammaproteobacteria bacterium]